MEQGVMNDCQLFMIDSLGVHWAELTNNHRNCSGDYVTMAGAESLTLDGSTLYLNKHTLVHVLSVFSKDPKYRLALATHNPTSHPHNTAKIDLDTVHCSVKFLSTSISRHIERSVRHQPPR